MAHWIYINPSSSAVIGSSNYNSLYGTDQYDNIIASKYVTLSGDVTGFPLHTSEVGQIFTQSRPASGLMLRCGDDSGTIYDSYWASIIGVYGSDYYRIIDGNLNESLYDQNYTMYNYQILPNKLFRVNSTAFDRYSVVYTDEPISGAFRMNGTGSKLPQACLVPAVFIVNGEFYEGIGNYSSDFSYKVKPDTGGYNSSGSGGANSTRNFLIKNTEMAPKYLKRQAGSNGLVLTDIQEGDVLDFGPFTQYVPSIFKDWIRSNCTEITNAAEPMSVDITSPNGIHLFTAGKLCAWDIKVIPKLEEREITENGEFKVNSGFAGISKVIVNVPTTQKISDFEWTLRETLDFSMIPSDLLGEIHFIYFGIPEAELYANTPFIGLRISDGVVTAIQYGENINTEVTLYDAEFGWTDPSYRTLHTYAAALSGILYAFLSGNTN